MRAYYNRGKLTLIERQRITWAVRLCVIIPCVLMFIFGLWDFAHAPQQPKASITINETLYQSYDRDGHIIYENNNYWCGVK
jgi:hypothetical protein